jgi:hypothetical protein
MPKPRETVPRDPFSSDRHYTTARLAFNGEVHRAMARGDYASARGNRRCERAARAFSRGAQEVTA